MINWKLLSERVYASRRYHDEGAKIKDGAGKCFRWIYNTCIYSVYTCTRNHQTVACVRGHVYVDTHVCMHIVYKLSNEDNLTFCRSKERLDDRRKEGSKE